jgi:hypothetical protein
VRKVCHQDEGCRWRMNCSWSRDAVVTMGRRAELSSIRMCTLSLENGGERKMSRDGERGMRWSGRWAMRREAEGGGRRGLWSKKNKFPISSSLSPPLSSTDRLLHQPAQPLSGKESTLTLACTTNGHRQRLLQTDATYPWTYRTDQTQAYKYSHSRRTS